MADTPISPTIMMLDPFTVDPDRGGRIGLFFPAKAEALGLMIKANGQNDPIKVVRSRKAAFEWTLVAGLHRLDGCLREGLEVAAIEVDADADLAAVQASENMDRRDLGPLERAMFVAAVADAAERRLKALHGDVSQQAMAGLARQNKVQFSDAEKADEEAAAARSNLSRAYGWRDETAEACGLSLSDLKRSMRIFRCIVAPNRDLMAAFQDHPVAQKASDLLELAGWKDAALRRKAIEALIGGPQDLGFVAAMLGVKPAPTAQTPYDKWTSQIRTGIGRLGTAEWRQFCPDLTVSLTPARVIELHKALAERIAAEGLSA